jgi:hypothetical protein
MTSGQRGESVDFSRSTNERAVEQKKHVEISSDEDLEWARAPSARVGAPRPAIRVLWRTHRLGDPKRPESGWKHAYAVTILSTLNENMVKVSEIGFVEGRKQFGRKAALKKLKANNARENETHWDSELWLKHEYRTSTERLPFERADGRVCYMCLCKSGRQDIQATTNLE